MYDALFEQVGVIRAQTFSDLLDMPAALATGRKLTGNRVAILTSTGGAGTLVSDSLGVAGFETPAPDEATAAKLRALQKGDHAALDRNPIDVTLAGLQPDLLRAAIRILLDSPSYDAVAVIVGSSSLAMPDLMANAIRDCLPDSDKPVIAYVSPHAPEVASLLNRRGVPAFSAPEACTVAIDAMLRAGKLSAVDEAGTPRLPLPDLAAYGTGSLDEAAAKTLFAGFGVPVAKEVVVAGGDEATTAAQTFSGNVVLKILSAEITHKSDVGGVAVNVPPAEVASRLARMASDVQSATGIAPKRFLVQEMVKGGVEVILGMHRDPLGTAILLGMGGVTAELFGDTTLRLLPGECGLTREAALEMIGRLKTAPLLQGFRGRPKADVEGLAEAIVAFSRMVATLGERLVEAEMNPVFVLPEGQGVVAADGVAVLAGNDKP